MAHQFTRRTFLKASGATVTLASIGYVNMENWIIHAEKNAEIKVIPSICNGCGNRCGIFVHTKNGRLWKITGNKDHPFSKGRVCARAHGAATWAYIPDRLTQPLKRTGENQFEPISWEQAFKEIGEKLNHIINQYGPQTIVYTHHPKPVGNFYAKRFMDAIGAPTFQSHKATCTLARDVAYEYVFGGVTGSDLSNSKYIMFIGRNYAEGIRPSSLQGTMEAKQNGAKVVIVDPRLNNMSILADEWLPIRPGTDLALVLAMAHILVKEDLYDKEFIENHTIGFDVFAKEVMEYTPEWAEQITSISKDTIIKIAREMAAAKPKALIEESWKGAFGSNYYNSTETGRAIAYFNAMLGNIQQEGGIFFGVSPKFGSLDETLHPTPPKPKAKRVDGAGIEGEYPLTIPSTGIAQVIPKKAMEGKVKALILNHVNPVLNFPDPNYFIEGYKKLDLLVVVDIQMSESAMLADYVLPEPTYLERDEVVEGVGGKKPTVTIRQKAIEKIHPNTRSFDEMIVGIAHTMGLQKYFNFTLDELNEAMLKPLGITLAELKQKGAITLNNSAQFGTVPKLKTASGKIEIYNEAFKKAGFNPVAQWIAPKVMPDQDSFRLIYGKQANHSHTATANIPMLMQITKDYDLTRLWINKSRADQLGIQDNDLVSVESDQAKSQIRVKVTERLHPDCVYLPGGYGAFSDKLMTSKDIGMNVNIHVPYGIEPMSGSAMTHEAIVRIRKVGI